MAKKKGRKRPSYEPNAEFVRHLMEQSGLSITDFAREKCACADSTLRKILARKPVDGQTLIDIARELHLDHWHVLLSDAERVRIGLASDDSVPEKSAPLAAKQVAAQPTAPLSPFLFQLPSVLPDFTGRKAQVQELAARLRGQGGKIGLSALRGMGGIGKTSLAVRVAHEVEAEFPDARLFLEMRGTADGEKESPVSAVEAMTRPIIHAFRPAEGALSDDEAELASVYRSVLVGKRAS